MTEASELEFLKWFFINADFGPADEDVRWSMEQEFKDETGKDVPAAYRVD